MRAPYVAVFALLVGCSASAARFTRFPLRDAMLRDVDDTRPLAARPAVYRSSDLWDFVDESFFSSAERGLELPPAVEADDVNAFDEVPASSWLHDVPAGLAHDAAALQTAACDGVPPLGASVSWRVVEAKPNGLNPGFVVRGPDGARYLLKADGARQPELTSAADAIASRLFWALGYNVPCNRVVEFPRDALVIEPAAGAARIEPALIDRVLAQATRRPDGRYRMGASRFLDGVPLGPFRYTGTRRDDLNDVVPHENRRELRALRLVDAWLNHYDAREQNTFTTWIATDASGAGYVRHWLLDFGDCFGSLWPMDGLSERSGYGYTVDLGEASADFLSLGLVRRPWDHVAIDPRARTFGYFGADHFDPAAWRPIEPNPAFERMTERDAAWMARRIARLDAAALHALVATGHFDPPGWTEHLEALLVARRARILARYFTRLAPLDDASVDGVELCATDLARVTAVRTAARYRAVERVGPRFDRAVALAVRTLPASRVCAHLAPVRASDAGVADDDPSRYRVVDLIGSAARDAPLRVHLYDLGVARGFRIVGLERPPTAAWPP